MGSEVMIRNAEIGDSEEAAELVRQLGYPAEARDIHRRLEALLERSDHLVALAELGGHVVGIVCACWGLHLEREGPCGRITALVVAAGHRDQRIGALLLSHAESWLRAQRATSCVVNSHKRRIDAHRFYEREGYQMNGVRLFKEL